jgi:hypothetical protein
MMSDQYGDAGARTDDSRATGARDRARRTKQSRDLELRSVNYSLRSALMRAGPPFTVHDPVLGVCAFPRPSKTQT